MCSSTKVSDNKDSFYSSKTFYWFHTSNLKFFQYSSFLYPEDAIQSAVSFYIKTLFFFMYFTSATFELPSYKNNTSNKQQQKKSIHSIHKYKGGSTKATAKDREDSSYLFKRMSNRSRWQIIIHLFMWECLINARILELHFKGR